MAERRAASEGRRQAEAVRWHHALGHAPIRDLFGFLDRRYPSVLAVRYPMPGGPEGVLVDVGARRLLAVNSADRGLGRQRFTAAHLLGHLLLDTDLSPLHLDHDLPGGASGAELRADTFAAHFLFPEPVLRERVAGGDLDLGKDGQVASLALEYGMCGRSLAWHLNQVLGLADGDRRRIAALDVAALAARMGIDAPVRQERAARNARGWPGCYLALALEAYDRGVWSREQLGEALGDEALIQEITGGTPSDRGRRDESPVTLLTVGEAAPLEGGA